MAMSKLDLRNLAELLTRIESANGFAALSNNAKLALLVAAAVRFLGEQSASDDTGAI